MRCHKRQAKGLPYALNGNYVKEDVQIGLAAAAR